MAHRFRVSLVAAALGFLAAQPLQAQQEAPATPAESDALPEVTVTATRRETSLQETPIAVTALSSAAVAAANAHDLGDLAKFAPGFSAARLTAFNAASFAIRGVGQTDIIVYQEAPVSVIVDDFVLPSTQTQLLDTFDLERVEILRGPQGTTFGKNTTGGAVNITTKRPSLTDSSAQFQLEGGSFGKQEGKLAFNVPVIDGKLGIRFSGKYTKSDGYYRNGASWGPIVTFVPLPDTAGNVGTGDGKRVGGDDVFYGRLKALWQPVDNVNWLFQYEKLRDRSDAVPSYNDTPPGAPYLWNALGLTRPDGDPLDHMASSGRDEFLIREGSGQRVDVDGFYSNLDWQVGDLKVSSITGYRKQEERLPNTYTGAAPVTDDGQVISLFDAERDTDRDTFQQEVRAVSTFDGPVNQDARRRPVLPARRRARLLVAARRRGARRTWLRPHRPRRAPRGVGRRPPARQPRDDGAGHLRGRRRACRLDEAGRVRERRGRLSAPPGPRPPGPHPSPRVRPLTDRAPDSNEMLRLRVCRSRSG